MAAGGLFLLPPHVLCFTCVLYLNVLLQILARSSPTDKYNLVRLLKSRGEVVAVTGGLPCRGPKQPAWPAS